jgi:integrase
MAKRTHGTGSIYKLPSGKWRCLVTVDGKRISHTTKTRKEAETWARTTTTQVEQGLTYESARTTFGAILDDWLAIKATKLRAATMELYRREIRLYIKPQLGGLVVKDLNAARIQAFYSSLQLEGTGRRTIELVHTVLYGCLSHAHRLGLIAQNWAALVEPPRPEKREMAVWNESQVSQFLISAPDPAFYRLAFATGMRRGELIGLQWQDIDWQACTIKVRRQVFQGDGGGWKFQEPKTARGRRVIRLGVGLIQALRDHYNRTLPLAREIAGDRWQENDLVFPSSVGTPRNGYEVTKTFKRLAAEAGLPVIRFHDIRHTAASLMLSHGEPPVKVAGILGQSVAILLDTYAHYIPDDQAALAALMDEITSPVMVEFPQQIAHESRTK